MRRSILVPAALLLLSGLTTACASSAGDAAPATIAPATQSSASIDEPGSLEVGEPEDDWGLESASAPVDPNVIRFDDESGPAETVVAPPKREDIPGFQLFGTGPSESDPGPKLSLPDDVE